MFLYTVRTLKTGEMEVLTFLTRTAVTSHAKIDFLRRNPYMGLSISNEYLFFSVSFFVKLQESILGLG